MVVSYSRLLGLAIFMTGCLAAGCRRDNVPATKEDEKTAANSASISASPNPVPATSEKLAKTTITWDTGDGSIGRVFVQVNDREEQLFADKRPKGSQEAKFIGKGKHEFRLYSGKDQKKMLASVTVTREK